MHIVGSWNSRQKPAVSPFSVQFDNLSLDLSDQVTTLENETTMLVYEGTIFDRTPDELLGSQAALDDAYGLYSYVKISKHEHKIIIGTDKLGYSPLYYSIQGEELVFGTSLTLVKYRIRNSSIDYEAWDEILNLGDILGEKTTIKEIKRLAPGTRIHINDGKITFVTFWSPEIPDVVDRDDYIPRNNELVAEALELTRKTPEPKIVLLSGGEDSRRIGVTAKAINLPITFVTQEVADWRSIDDEIIIATQVAEHLELPLIKQKLPNIETFYNDKLIRDYWLAYETNQHEWVLPLIRNLQKQSLIYDGIAGDITINGGCMRLYPTWLEWYRNKDFDRVVEAICGDKKGLEKSPFQIDPKQLDSSLFDRTRAELLRYPDCPHRLNYFVLMNHTRRNTGLQAQLYNLMNHKICFPYLYYPLFMQSLSLDPEHQLEMVMHQACMKQVNSGISRIPSTTKGKVSDEYVIDRSQVKRERERLLLGKAKLRPEIKELFPHLRMHTRAFEFLSVLGANRFLSRAKWFVPPLFRMSNYLDWLEDSERPDFPVNADQPRFLKNRLI